MFSLSVIKKREKNIYIRKILKFEIIKTIVIALRGGGGAKLREAHMVSMADLHFNLEPMG